MNSLRAVIVLFTIYFTCSHALQCYNCIYYDGYKNSDPTCQHGPNISLVIECDEYPSPIGEIPVCKKVTGILDGKPAVIRGCSVSFNEFVGTCANNELRIGKSFTNDANACICSGERCNGATVATFSWAAIFAVAVLQTFYKLISAGGQ